MLNLAKWAGSLSWPWLQKLYKKFPRLEDNLPQLPGGKTALESSAGSPMANTALNWIKENPLTFISGLATAGIFADDVSEFFSDKEMAMLKNAVGEDQRPGVTYPGLFTDEEAEIISSGMGDGVAGSYLGKPLDKVISTAQDIANSVRRTDLLLGKLEFTDVDDLTKFVMALRAFEPEGDPAIYKIAKGRTYGF